MSEHPSTDPFEGCELSPNAILGTRTFEGVLFTDETETPVSVLTGETPEHSQATVDEAQAFAAGIDSDTPHIALPVSVEAQVETRGKPYTAAAFFHFKATGSLKRHRAYHDAYNSDTFSVAFEADYETGDLMITVEEEDCQSEVENV
ncbi:hypothetical protein NDI76_20790 [Halogeometricum sp. S1BR25-6]|uniref:DUF8025 domain-containing protein n=1 Tax=Halogeometricum salsisoli TaxID=2950536 RepID=A0ABU2GM88_9EURY|nr:hypothetical protein [Halogeometricum sp. S1BR25-6]MDS0301178.1 hypothetical protein [Halogeometricum sp. S1BR25-6]